MVEVVALAKGCGVKGAMERSGEGKRMEIEK